MNQHQRDAWDRLVSSFMAAAQSIASDDATSPELRARIHLHLQHIRKITTASHEPLEAPARLRGRFGRFSDPALKKERADWAAAAGKAGYPANAVATALGLSPFSARAIMKSAGWNWHDQQGYRLIDRQNRAWSKGAASSTPNHSEPTQ